jgi:hypothetical protein
MKAKKIKKSRRLFRLIILMLFVIILAISLFIFIYLPKQSSQKQSAINKTLLLDEREIKTTPEGLKYIIHPDELSAGGPPKGGIGVDIGIPAIKDPEFTNFDDANKWIKDNELIILLEYKNESRVYPLQIMVWHEIVNDIVAGDPLLISYCPLCGSAIAYQRRVNSQDLLFGTSGKLYNSDLVMYDSATDSLWVQIGGLAVAGPLTGTKLEPVAIHTIVWRDFKNTTLANISKILSRNTGFSRNYGRDPYGNYYESSYLFFPVDNEDKRIHPKTVIYGVEVNGKFKAYTEDDLKELKTIEDTIGSARVIIQRDNLGKVSAQNLDTGAALIAERDFWFAWYAFHPTTQLYQKER